jgi:microcystin degradation protein MlrC
MSRPRTQPLDGDTSAPSQRAPRVGVLGFFLESNRWSPVTTAAMFAAGCDLAGLALQQELARDAPRTLPDSAGFVAQMNLLGAWELVPLRMAAAQPGGPADHEFFVAFLDDIAQRLQDAGPLDAVFVSSHGAALTTEEDDPDGVLFALVRRIVGPRVPVLAVLDLHTNVSLRMANALSAFVAYRTNPHTDLRECGQEAALHLHTLLAHGPGVVELVKLPFVPPATSQLIEPGTPYAELVDQAHAHVVDDILNVSLCGGFALADCAKCGFSVVVTAANGRRDIARGLALELAKKVWDMRHAFVSRLTPLDVAVATAVDTGRTQGPKLILADVGDNPGGGGGGNTVTLLKALVQAGAASVVLGVFTDPTLAREAHAVGVGAKMSARFNRDRDGDLFARPFEAPARVLAVSDGVFVGRQGLVKGSEHRMGLSALLQVGGVQVVVISERQQLLDPAQLDLLGIDLSQARTLVVKSRGHFRAAFTGFTVPDRILEVDCPGLTTPNLAALPWTRLSRPAYPIDLQAQWPAATIAP